MSEPMVSIHNRFRVEVRDAATEELLQEAFGENMVLDRIYTRLLQFNTYFVNIVFGSGTGALAADRTTLFSRVGHKAAADVELIREYPMSTWTRKIRLGTTEFNGNTITEVGISEDTTAINTHALLKDSNGDPVGIVKNNTTFIDIFCTVYVTLYNVDTGLFWYGTGLRDYLTGGSAPTSNNLSISYLNDPTTITGTRTYDLTNKAITLAGRFGEEDFNQEVKHIDWDAIGLRCVMPRTGVWAPLAKTGVALGTANGVLDVFTLPHYNISNLVIKVGGVENSNWTRQLPEYNKIKFNPIPASGEVTADYTCLRIPKDMTHALDVSMTINFAASEPDPVMSDPTEPATFPAGSLEDMVGDMVQGFYGEVSAANFISGNDLATYLSLTAGTAQNTDAGWLKCVLGGRFLFVAKKTFRYNLSWDNINAASAIYGTRHINIGGHIFAIKLLTSDEWDRIIQPLHKDGIGPRLYSYTDADLGVTTGNGRGTWTSTPSGSSRVTRGVSSVGYSGTITPSNTYSYIGWRPVLEFIA